MANPTITTFLTAEHREIDSLFSEAESTGCDDDGLAFMTFHAALIRHLGIEEQVLYDLYEIRNGDGGPIAPMRADHERIRILLGRAAQERSCRSDAAFRTAMKALGTATQRHYAQEEKTLYPLFDGSFAGETGKLIEAMEAMAGVQY